MIEIYNIPENVSISEINHLLNRLQKLKSAQNFEFEINSRKLIFKKFSDLPNLLQYKQQNKILSVFDSYHIINKCIHAGFEAAKNNIFIGGYQMEDFVIQPHVKDIRVQLLVRPDRIIDVLSKRYNDCAAPEVREKNLLTEKADFWSYGIIFYNLVKTGKQLEIDEKDEYSQISFLRGLQIQNQQLIENLVRFLDKNYETRVGYEQFFSRMTPKCPCASCVTRLRSFTKQDNMDEILRIRGLKELRIIGQGSFGKVILVENENKKQFALKIIAIHNQEDMNKSCSEVWFMFFNKGCQFIVNIVDVQKVVIKNQIYIIVLQEYAQLGDLRQFMKTYRIQLGRKHMMKLFYDIASALMMMKSENMIHRDIKPENVLIVRGDDGSIIAKLADFGSDELLLNDSGSDSFVGTPGYIAPEVIYGGYVSYPVDMWGIGIILQEYTEEKELIGQCLVDDPQKRITIDASITQLQQYKEVVVYIQEISYVIEQTENELYDHMIVRDNFTFSNYYSIK